MYDSQFTVSVLGTLYLGFLTHLAAPACKLVIELVQAVYTGSQSSSLAATHGIHTMPGT